MLTVFWLIALLSLYESSFRQAYTLQVASIHLIILTCLQVESAHARKQPSGSRHCNQFSFGFSLNLAMLWFILACLNCWSLSEVTHHFVDWHWHRRVICNTHFSSDSPSKNVSWWTICVVSSSQKTLEQGYEVSSSWFSAGTFNIFMG